MERNELGATAPKGYKNIRKKEIISKTAKKADCSKAKAAEVVDAYWSTIKETIKANPKANISIPNVGSIKTVKKSARTYSTKGLKNTSKKTVKVAAKNVAKFTVSTNFLKDTTVKKRKSTKKSTKRKSTKKK